MYKTTITLPLPHEHHIILKNYAYENDLSVMQVMRRIVKEFIESSDLSLKGEEKAGSKGFPYCVKCGYEDDTGKEAYEKMKGECWYCRNKEKRPK